MADYTINVRQSDTTSDFPHYWEKMIGSDRAEVTMRKGWQDALDIAVKNGGFQTVRFHGLLDDEFGVYRLSEGVTELRTLYMDQCFDMLLAKGVRPFVEISFMPPPLASGTATVDWYEGLTSPPNDWSAWSSLMVGIASHLVDRYGIDEVSQWRFEVWNEPTENSWAGTQDQYFQLYAATAVAFKSVSAQFQVGGPATSQIQWIGSFLTYCSDNNVPIDFVSTHVYPGDPQINLFGKDLSLPSEEVVPRAVQAACARVRASKFPNLPLVISEWGAQNPAFIAYTMSACSDLCDAMCYWAVSTIFEENGPVKGFDTEYFGLLDQGSVPRASMHVFSMLHNLGTQKINTRGKPCIVTRSSDGSLKILAWNLPSNSDVAKMGTPGPEKALQFNLEGKSGTASVTIIDPVTFGVDVLYNSWGRPPSPTRAQYALLNEAGVMPSPVSVPLVNGTLNLTLTSNSVAYIEVS